MCALLVGLPDVLAVDDQPGLPVRVHVESRPERAWCRGCAVRARVKDRPVVELIDLPCFGRSSRLVWHKHRWRCPERACAVGSWTHVDERIAAPRVKMTARAARWATRQVGKLARSVNELADELGCDWHTVNDTVVAYGEALLVADTDRVGAVDALGLDGTLFFRKGPRHLKQWSTSIVDAGGPDRTAKLNEVAPGRTAARVSEWLDAQSTEWRAGIRWGCWTCRAPTARSSTTASAM